MLGGIGIAQFGDIPQNERRDEQRKKDRRDVAVHPFQQIIHCGMAKKESNPARKKELLQIAENCANIPARPASSYWEALQFIYLTQLAIQLEGNGLAISIGRLDKYLYPYYKADLDAGKIDHDSALELMECFYLKLSEIDKISSNESTLVNTGPAHGQTITIGGTLADGSDCLLYTSRCV